MKKIILSVAAAAIAIMAVAAPAFAGVERNQQTQSMTITAVQPEGFVGQWTNVWTHTYNVTLDNNGSFTGVGEVSGTVNGFLGTETITGHLDGNTISFAATRDDGLVYSLANAPLDNTTVTNATSNPGAPWVLEFKVSAVTTGSDYKNHGDYVSSMGGGADAAHSPIGKPIKSK